VIIGGTIEHVENPSHVLREINRVLVHDGRLVLSTTQANYYWTFAHNVLRRWVRDQDEGQHLSNWDILSMIRLLKRNGFEVIKVYGTSFTIPPFRFEIPCKPFPMLGWDVVYFCRKRREPDNRFHTNVNDKYVKLKKTTSRRHAPHLRATRTSTKSPKVN
jgi:SAM-dependent methyltransferase